MNILLDHCLNWRLKRLLPGHDTVATSDMGWETIRNGQLLTLAEEQFDVFLTVDKGIKYQQNMTGRTIAVITLRAVSNSITVHAPLMPQVLALLPTVEPGRVYLITEATQADNWNPERLRLRFTFGRTANVTHTGTHSKCSTAPP